MRQHISSWVIAGALVLFPFAGVSAQQVFPGFELFPYIANVPVLTDLNAAPTWVVVPGRYGGNMGVWNSSTEEWMARGMQVRSTKTNAPNVISVWINGSDVTEDYLAHAPSLFGQPVSEFGTTTIRIKVSQPLPTNRLYFSLPANAQPPQTVGVRAKVGGQMVTIAASAPLYGAMEVSYPQVVSDEWETIMTHAGPLFLASFPLPQFSEEVSEYTVSFMREPKQQYQLFLGGRAIPNAYASLGTPQWNGYQEKITPITNVFSNAAFIDEDSDGDGLGDIKDNCPFASNTSQEDLDENGRGDACDDVDGDGLVGVRDNCPLMYNPDQTNIDADDLGNACDASDDRVGKKYPWLAWAGIGFAALSLLVFTGLQMKDLQKRA